MGILLFIMLTRQGGDGPHQALKDGQRVSSLEVVEGGQAAGGEQLGGRSHRGQAGVQQTARGKSEVDGLLHCIQFTLIQMEPPHPSQPAALLN